MYARILITLTFVTISLSAQPHHQTTCADPSAVVLSFEKLHAQQWSSLKPETLKTLIGRNLTVVAIPCPPPAELAGHRCAASIEATDEPDLPKCFVLAVFSEEPGGGRDTPLQSFAFRSNMPLGSAM